MSRGRGLGWIWGSVQFLLRLPATIVSILTCAVMVAGVWFWYSNVVRPQSQTHPPDRLQIGLREVCDQVPLALPRPTRASARSWCSLWPTTVS